MVCFMEEAGSKYNINKQTGKSDSKNVTCGCFIHGMVIFFPLYSIWYFSSYSVKYRLSHKSNTYM